MRCLKGEMVMEGLGEWAYEEGACEGGFDIGFGGLSLHC